MRILCLVPPGPPRMNVWRDYAGGYGTAERSTRADYGLDPGKFTFTLPSCLNTAAILEQEGFQVAVIDGNSQHLNLQELFTQVQRFHPDYVLAVTNLPSIDGDIQLLRMIRDTCKPTRLVCYGTVCRVLYERLLREAGVDAVLFGDPEVQALPLFKAFAAGDDHSSQAGIASIEDGVITKVDGTPMLTDLNTLPFPAYHLIQSQHDLHRTGGNWSAAVFSTKGCPFACAYYCPYPYGFGKTVLFRDPVKVVDEIDRLRNEFDFRSILFRDQVFTLKRQHAEAICKGLIERNIDVRWECETKYDRVDKDLLHLMKQAGCWVIHYGLESGDEELFWKIGKPGGKTPSGAMETFRRTIQETRAVGIRAHTHTIVGLPGETWSSIQATVQRLRDWNVDSLSAAAITPYPGTQLYEEARAHGWIRSEHMSAYSGFSPVMDLPTFSANEMTKAQRRIKEYWKDPFLVRARRRLWRSWRQALSHMNSLISV